MLTAVIRQVRASASDDSGLLFNVVPEFQRLRLTCRTLLVREETNRHWHTSPGLLAYGFGGLGLGLGRVHANPTVSVFPRWSNELCTASESMASDILTRLHRARTAQMTSCVGNYVGTACMLILLVNHNRARSSTGRATDS